MRWTTNWQQFILEVVKKSGIAAEVVTIVFVDGAIKMDKF